MSITYNLTNSTDKANLASYENNSDYTSGSFRVGNNIASTSAKCYTSVIKFEAPVDISKYSTLDFKITNAYWIPKGTGGTVLTERPDKPGSYYHVNNNSSGDADAMFRFAISSSDTEFKNVSSATAGDGFVSCITNEANGTHSQGYYTLTGSTEITAKELVATNPYYLWLFPGGYSFSSSYRYWGLGYNKDYPTVITLTFSGENVPTITSTILWVFDDKRGWLQGTQRVFNGTSWL